MPNVLDYLDWMGDQPLDAVPANEVDNVVLAQVVYLDLAGCVPGERDGAGDGASVAEVARRFFAAHPKEELYAVEGLVSPLTPFVLQRMAAGRRFRDVVAGRWREVFDPEAPEQFAAATFLLPDGTRHLAFRGTDDTLDGWREDFVMSYGVGPAQREALAYLEGVAAATEGPLVLGGHSKGGNLALYAAASAAPEVRSRIRRVWCDDSPGFAAGMVDPRALGEVAGRVRLLVPEYCVVGAMLDQPAEPEVVASDAEGALQHDAMSWQVRGTSFVRRPSTCPASQRLASTIRALVEGHDADGRRRLTEAIFGCLAASGATTVSGLGYVGIEGLSRVVAAVAAIEEPDRTTIWQLMIDLLGQAFSEALALPGQAAGDGGAPAGDAADAGGDDVGTDEASDGAISVEEMRAFRTRRRVASVLGAPARALGRLAGGMRDALRGAVAGDGGKEAPGGRTRPSAGGAYVTIPRKGDAPDDGGPCSPA